MTDAPDVSALEAIETARAMRYLRLDPVPEALLRRLVHAATCASSPGNSQGWDFVVVRDAAQRRALAEAIGAALRPLMPPVPEVGDATRRRMLAGAHHLLAHLDDVPAWIFVCGRPVYPPNAPSADWIAAATLPAAQNLIVAARALGLGAAFTTYHKPCEPRVREILGLPDDVRIEVTVPIGWPAKPFGPVTRKPIGEVLHFERW